jgi:hypothetical protein
LSAPNRRRGTHLGRAFAEQIRSTPAPFRAELKPSPREAGRTVAISLPVAGAIVTPSFGAAAFHAFVEQLRLFADEELPKPS